MYNNHFFNNPNQQQTIMPSFGNSHQLPYQSFYNSPQQQQNINNQFIVTNVNNFDEAKNTTIDFYNTYIFTDFNNSAIYLRRVNNNGLEDFYTFKLTENPPDRMQVLEQRLINIENFLRGGIKNDESNDTSTFPANAEQDAISKPSNVSKGTTNASGKKS